MANNRELSQFANTVGYSDGSVGIGTAKPLDPPHASNTKVLSVGIVTANYLYGDGSNLTGVSGTGPQGAQGVQGATGPTGPTGPTGCYDTSRDRD